MRQSAHDTAAEFNQDDRPGADRGGRTDSGADRGGGRGDKGVKTQEICSRQTTNEMSTFFGGSDCRRQTSAQDTGAVSSCSSWGKTASRYHQGDGAAQALANAAAVLSTAILAASAAQERARVETVTGWYDTKRQPSEVGVAMLRTKRMVSARQGSRALQTSGKCWSSVRPQAEAGAASTKEGSLRVIPDFGEVLDASPSGTKTTHR